MAIFTIPHVKINGISACVPKNTIRSEDESVLVGEGAQNFIKMTGIEQRRKADDMTCSSDLCVASAEKILADLKWDRRDIDLLVFVTQTPDYPIPATACTIQRRLELPSSCCAFDINLGCSGWVYGLSVISALLSRGLKKGLLLVGDTVLKFSSKEDKSTYPLFGDAGSATALSYEPSASGLSFDLNTDGEGYKAIRIDDGGYRNPVTKESFVVHERENGIKSNQLQMKLDGMDVFSFGISRAPESVSNLLMANKLTEKNIDFFLFHQANMFMNEKIRKKLKLPAEKVPYSINKFGNTSCASIPLTMVNNLHAQLISKDLTIVGCGFGVGLSWGSVLFTTEKIIVPELLEI